MKAKPDADRQARRVFVRALLAVTILGAGNVAYFWRNSDVFEKLMPQPAALNGLAERHFGQAPQDACAGEPVRMIASLEHLIALESRVSGADTLRLALMRLGIEAMEIDRVEAALRTTVDPALLTGRGMPFRVRLDDKFQIQGLELEFDAGHLIQVCRRGNSMRARNLQYALRTGVEPVVFQLDRDASLLSAVEAVGEQADLARQLASLLRYEMDPGLDLRPGDRVEVLVEKRFLGADFHRYGTILAFGYRGAAGQFRYFYRATGQGEFAYYDHGGLPLRRAQMYAPTDWFAAGDRGGEAWAPEQIVVNRVRGAEYPRPTGLPIHAPCDATVTAIEQNPKIGLTVELEDFAGRKLRLSSLARVLGFVKLGERISQGDVIAFVGRSGASAHSLLRIEIEESDGNWVYYPEFVTRMRGEPGASRVGERLVQEQLDAHRRAVRPWAKALIAARREQS